MKTINNFLVLLVFSIFVISCGKSPFMNEGESKNSNNSVGDYETNLILEQNENDRSEQGQTNEIQVNLKGVWGREPNLSSEASLILVLSDKDGKRLATDLEINAYLWMPDMGHGSFPITITKLSDGLYEFSELFFNMGGFWELHVELIDGEDTLEDVVWPIEL